MHEAMYLENDVVEYGRLAVAEPLPERSRIEQRPMSSIKLTGKVLIVDDEPDILFMLTRRLEGCGHQVITAADGFSATQMATQHRPDVVILDIGMPCGDGHTVAGRMRSNANLAMIPIIYLTARTGQSDKNRAYEAGAYAYVTKPFEADELLSLVNQALSDWR